MAMFLPTTNNQLLTVFLFLLGLAIGSFINVVSRRLLRGEPIKGRSHCESCGKELAWYDLIPLLSFILLRGRCRYCKAKFSWQYPLVELGTGLLFAALYTVSGQEALVSGSLITHHLSLISLLVASSCLIVVFVTDLLAKRVFDIALWVGIAFALLYRLLITHHAPLITFLYDLLLAAGVFAFFWFLRAVTKGRGMGEGDPPLGFLTALLVGFPLGLVMFFLTAISGATIGLVLMLLRKKKFGDQIAFGPFLVVSTFATILFGEPILNWYLGILGF
jgi:leader peptidase (prepilin peptidase)/N-methyltransferase